MHLSELKAIHVSELIKMGEALEIENVARMRKQELMFAIMKKRAKNGEQVFGDGVLEVLPDGFGFLRSPEASYMASTDDIYLSPSQVRRFNLHTGDMVEGEVRVPRTASATSRWSRSTRSTTSRPRRASTRSCSRT
jgi:transcription termination factor Rho